MRNDKLATQFSSREFIGQIRRALIAARRPDVRIERGWIGQDEDGRSLLLRVPIGPEHLVPLRLRHEADETDIAAGRGRDAVFFAEALMNLNAAENMLVKYASDIRQAAVAAVEAARANGLDIQFEKVDFRPISAWQMTGGDWKQAACHILAAVTVRHTSAYLRQETTTFWVEELSDVAIKMDDIVKDKFVSHNSKR